MKNNRRNFLKKSATVAVAVSVAGLSGCTESGKSLSENKKKGKIQWPPVEGPDTPKFCITCRSDASPEYMRKLKQIGLDHVLMSGPSIPWTGSGLKTIVNNFKSEGLNVINMMISGFPNVIYGREGRDAEIQNVKDSIIAAGAAGIPVVEYNFYAHRLTEGYYHQSGRGGAGYTAFDYERTGSPDNDPKWMYPEGRTEDQMNTAPKDLPAMAEIGNHTYEELWDNITYFLEAVIPVAEKAGVRMALHPNDPPVPVSRGSEQIMGTFDDWKKLVNIVDSPSNGMTFDCGVSNEIGADPLEVLDYMASRDRINHVHFRNCIGDIPRTKYVEVFPDNGTVNLFEIMKALVERKYKYGLYPEHPRILDYDKEHPGGGEYTGFAYNVAYARAMMQAVMSL